MAAEFDTSEFVDTEFEAARQGSGRSAAAHSMMHAPTPPEGLRAPSREEMDTKSTDMQAKLAALKQQQNELERERSAIEDLRRRQNEFSVGRGEMQEQLTRAIALLEESEFAARREAEQIARSLVGLKDALGKVQGINDQAWTRDDFSNELTRALTTIENARMEYNGARLKFPVLDLGPDAAGAPEKRNDPGATPFASLPFGAQARLGLALTWPVLVAALIVALVLLVRR